MKIILFVTLAFPIWAAAYKEFIASGGGSYCYKEYSEALFQAQMSADNSAVQICNQRRVRRVSEYVRSQGGQCTVMVKAKYSCQ